MQYQALVYTDVKSLEQAVEMQLEQGWVLQGGLTLLQTDDRIWYGQAMTYTEAPILTRPDTIEVKPGQTVEIKQGGKHDIISPIPDSNLDREQTKHP